MKKEIDNLLNKASEQARDRAGTDSRLDESASRAWEHIEAGAENGAMASPSAESRPECARFSNLIPAYCEGTLAEAQATLLEEHMKECYFCKSALRRLQSGKPEGETAASRETRTVPVWMKWGSVAAGLVIMIMSAQFLYWAGMLPLVSAEAVTISSLEGSLYCLDGRDLHPVSAGEAFTYGKTLRTGPETRAVVTLGDGSEVELAERTEFDVVGGWKGDSIRLNRGNIIIQASPQGSGELQVLTGDCEVAVKGTIFSVRHGLKGSRVSVVEGEVWVTRAGENTVLNAGQQYASRDGLGLRSVEEEVAWSKNSSEYFEMLTAVTRIHRAIGQVAMSDELRYSGALARILPRDTMIYGAAPNVVDRAGILFQAIEDAVRGNPRLYEFWESEKGREMQSHIDEIEDLAGRMEGLFGEELVFAFSRVEGMDPCPVILAESVNQPALIAEINVLNDKIAAESKGVRPFAVIDDPFGPGLSDAPFFAWCGNGLLVVSPSLELVQQVAASDAAGGAGGFAESTFYQTVAVQYDQGVDWLLAVDFPTMLEAADKEEGGVNSDEEFLNPFTGIESLVARRKIQSGQPENQLIFSFSREPGGILNWLSEPMPMGAMDFVSPDATMAAGLALRDPLEIMDEILEQIAASGDPGALSELDEFQADLGISVRDDIAASLGGEALIALDGAILPEPAWKLILEVYDEAGFQRSIEYLAEAINAREAANGRNNKLALYAEPAGGNTLYSLQLLESGTVIYYLFARGYLVAAPDYSIIDKALQYQASGYSLSRSPDFIASLPSGVNIDLSAFYYHDFRRILDTMQAAATAANIGSSSLASFLEEGSLHFMTGVYRTDGELVISSSNNLEDCIAWMGLIQAWKEMLEEKIN